MSFVALTFLSISDVMVSVSTSYESLSEAATHHLPAWGTVASPALRAGPPPRISWNTGLAMLSQPC
jgi:hypothetical protein